METVRLRFCSTASFWRNLLCFVIFGTILVCWFSARAKNYAMLYDLSDNSLKYVFHKEKTSKFLNSSEAKRLINEHNQAETILNLEDFGPIENNTVILVISVSELNESLKYLIASLCDLTGIQDTLLVFSHLTFDDKLNHFIKSIDCCRVLQIFYPYSLQIFEDEFPGYEYQCPYNMGKERAKALNCSLPDTYGRFRKPLQAQKKHHWWWTANRIFENFLLSKGYNGIVVFLEDDIFVLNDFLYMVIYMHKLTKSMPQCEFLYLGLHNWSLENNMYNVDLTTWDPKKHSSVLAFDVSVWNIIVQNYDLFCNADDSSWSRSLMYVSLNRRNKRRFKVAYSTIPRAIKITICFFNGLYNTCNVLDNVIRALRMQRYLKSNLFPPYLEVLTHIELEDEDDIYFDVLEGEADWYDPRDKALCKVNITQNKVILLLREMTVELPESL